MTNSNYLIKVIGLSSIPKIFTSILTLVSFPIMIRSVGPSEYGIYIYIGAILAVLESFVDFGISSAAGKRLAEIRVLASSRINLELIQWFRFQILFAFIGLIPLFISAWLIFTYSSNIKINYTLLFIIVFTIWLTISVNFAKTCLRSYLAFKQLAVLDTLESICRSFGFIFVAFYFPSSYGLAIVGLLNTVVVGILSSLVLFVVSKKNKLSHINEIEDFKSCYLKSSFKTMLRESLSFLGLRITTRLFQATPIIAFGVFGSELVGVFSAFSKVTEIVTFPFITIGNALAVKAQEVKNKGLIAVNALWDVCYRLIILACIITCGFFIASKSIVSMLLPGSMQFSYLFPYFSILLMVQILSCIICPLSDYIGGLKKRVFFLSALVVIQIVFLWVSVLFFNKSLTFYVYLSIQVFMIIGYYKIAKKTFFDIYPYVLPKYIITGLFVILFSFSFSSILFQFIKNYIVYSLSIVTLEYMIFSFYLLVTILCFFVIKILRKNFLTLSFFEF